MLLNPRVSGHNLSIYGGYSNLRIIPLSLDLKRQICRPQYCSFGSWISSFSPAPEWCRRRLLLCFCIVGIAVSRPVIAVTLKPSMVTEVLRTTFYFQWRGVKNFCSTVSRLSLAHLLPHVKISLTLILMVFSPFQDRFRIAHFEFQCCLGSTALISRRRDYLVVDVFRWSTNLSCGAGYADFWADTVECPSSLFFYAIGIKLSSSLPLL